MARPQAGARGNMVPMAVWCHHRCHPWPLSRLGAVAWGRRFRLLATARPPPSAPCYSFMAEQAGSQ